MPKILDDRWNTNPPQVTSFLTHPSLPSPNEPARKAYLSPTCGFGWRFEFVESSEFRVSKSNPRVKELASEVAVEFQPHLCSSMPLSNFSIHVKVTYPTGKTNTIYDRDFHGVSVAANFGIGTYEEPSPFKGRPHFEITLTFVAADGLSLPTTPSINVKKALTASLDGPSFVDTKFYLYSAKIKGRPARPKAVFAKSLLLTIASNYFRDMLSLETGFGSGTPCSLREDVPEEVDKLRVDAYDYDSDSDLETLDDDDGGKHKGNTTLDDVQEQQPSTSKLEAPATIVPEIEEQKQPSSEKVVAPHEDGRAFAINGTAYRTWKAFIFYTYTNDIRFNSLRSERMPKLIPLDSESIRCSPKSMYRFADYADLPTLKALAKKGIKENLSKTNIVTELFSPFTSRYQELIELEVDFLVNDFTRAVAQELDETLQLVVMGAKPHCYRILAFTMRRLRGESTQTAWNALEGGSCKGPRSFGFGAAPNPAPASSGWGRFSFPEDIPTAPHPPPVNIFGFPEEPVPLAQAGSKVKKKGGTRIV